MSWLATKTLFTMSVPNVSFNQFELDLPVVALLCDRQRPRRIRQRTRRRRAQVEAHTRCITTSPLGGRYFLVLPVCGALNLGGWSREREVERGVEFAIVRPCVSWNAGVAPHEVHVHGRDGP
jgi:hypothetical protein